MLAYAECVQFVRHGGIMLAVAPLPLAQDEAAFMLPRNAGVLSRMSSLTQKLHPDRFTEMSPFMAAIVGHVLGESWTDPGIAEITVSEQEDLVYFRKVGGVGFDGVHSLTDLRNNWNRLLDAAELTPEERHEAVRLFCTKVATVPGTAL